MLVFKPKSPDKVLVIGNCLLIVHVGIIIHNVGII